MTAWMLTIETPPGITDSEDSLLAFSDALDDARGLTGAATSLDTDTGVLSASFTLDAEDVQRAVDDAVSVFNTALDRIGLPHGNVIHVDAEPIEEREPALA